MEPAQFQRFRERLGITQAELARWLGVSRASVCRWEAGKRHIGSLVVLALKHVGKDHPEKEEFTKKVVAARRRKAKGDINHDH
jgi:DNA-binding transcriptional regulator YiaG